MAGSGKWYRDIGDTYTRYAAKQTNPAAVIANTEEAERYYALADHMDSLDLQVEEEEQ